LTPEKYQKYIDSCKTRDELLTLINNTLNKGRADLADIAKGQLENKFPINETSWKPSTRSSPESIPFELAKEVYKNHPTLSRDQIEFLARHLVPERSIFNAKGLSKSTYQQRMRNEDCDIAYGTTPCEKAGHTLRVRSGHCVQCNTATLSFQLRNKSSGEVYVVESSREPRIVKVGSSVSSATRLSNLNSEQYAGRTDWASRYYYGVKNMGMVEFEIHATLSKYAITDKYYLSNGNRTLCREIFSCSAEMAINALKEIVSRYT
jgi:hypothetical protein